MRPRLPPRQQSAPPVRPPGLRPRQPSAFLRSRKIHSLEKHLATDSPAFSFTEVYPKAELCTQKIWSTSCQSSRITSSPAFSFPEVVFNLSRTIYRIEKHLASDPLSPAFSGTDVYPKAELCKEKSRPPPGLRPPQPSAFLKSYSTCPEQSTV